MCVKLESQEEDGDIEVEEAEGEENDRPYNLRQRKTVDRYQAPPIGRRHYVTSLFLLLVAYSASSL